MVTDRVKPFVYFDHTADTLFRAYGNTFSEALANTILATYNVIVETRTVQPARIISFEVSAKKKTSLVYDVIEELLFLMDTKSFLAHEVVECNVEEVSAGLKAKVILRGDTHAEKYDVAGQIKAPTYNQMLIGEENNNIFIQVVLDL